MIDNYYLYKNINELVKIIHGKGNYILKEEIHKYLKNNKKVITYKLDLFNDGVTIVEI